MNNPPPMRGSWSTPSAAVLISYIGARMDRGWFPRTIRILGNPSNHRMIQDGMSSVQVSYTFFPASGRIVGSLDNPAPELFRKPILEPSCDHRLFMADVIWHGIVRKL